MENINFFVVFIEGLLSFFSPCILPILPIYLSMLSNSSIDSLKSNERGFIKTSLFKNTIFFTLGISTTFFILGSSVQALSSFFSHNKEIIMFIGGIIIIFMGLFYMGVIKSSLLSREKRFNMEVKEMKPLSAYLLGFTFSFGWTPCIGPILASVLIMASSSKSSQVATLLIIIYTLGFIVPFILTAVFYNKLFKSIDKIKYHMETIKKIGGVIIIASGLFMLINSFSSVTNYFDIDSKNNIEESESIEESKNENEESKDEKVKALDFTLKDQYGNEHKLSDYKGKTIFLNFWATWCPPCKEEMPYIEEIYSEYNKNNEDVIILGVAAPNLGREGSKEDVINFLNDNNYTFPVLMDEGGELIYKYGINAFPSTFVIDEEGNIGQYVPGAMDKDTMKYIINMIKK